MADRPVVMMRQAGGGGMEFFIEYPPGMKPCPVMLSEAHKDALPEIAQAEVL